MTNKMPFRRTILHFAQRFRMDGDTFITPSPKKSTDYYIEQAHKVLIIPVYPGFVQSLLRF